MGCQSAVYIGDYLTFSICTHDPDTGELTDADAAPTWRLYEDETAVPILTGTMARLDAGNTTGFYTERILCSAANGFEDRRTYTLYIEATVDGDTGGICYGFRAILSGSESLAGAIEFTYTVTDSVTGFPIPEMDIWITTDILGANVIWRGTTDAFGIARDVLNRKPWLDPGTYYFWKQKQGYSDDQNPDTEVVS